MQSDVRIGVSGARIGFAGPAVILNTMYEMDQSKFDNECPSTFQSAEYLQAHGSIRYGSRVRRHVGIGCS